MHARPARRCTPDKGTDIPRSLVASSLSHVAARASPAMPGAKANYLHAQDAGAVVERALELALIDLPAKRPAPSSVEGTITELSALRYLARVHLELEASLLEAAIKHAALCKYDAPASLGLVQEE